MQIFARAPPKKTLYVACESVYVASGSVYVACASVNVWNSAVLDNPHLPVKVKESFVFWNIINNQFSDPLYRVKPSILAAFC